MVLAAVKKIGGRCGPVACAILMPAVWLVCGCALQDDVVVVDQRVSVLQRRISKQEKELDKLHDELVEDQKRRHTEQEAVRVKLADLHALIRDIRDDIQLLRGRVEETAHAVEEKVSGLDEEASKRQRRWQALEHDVRSALDRVVRVEEFLGMEPSEKMATTAEPGPEPEKTLYAKAKKKFDQGHYEAARALFDRFLKEYPKSRDADNAQFWIGEIYYREKWYEKAILEYQKVIERYPKGNKVNSALLKQGFAFLNLGDKDNARLILKELVRKYPDSREAGIAREKLAKLQ